MHCKLLAGVEEMRQKENTTACCYSLVCLAQSILAASCFAAVAKFLLLVQCMCVCVCVYRQRQSFEETEW